MGPQALMQNKRPTTAMKKKWGCHEKKEILPAQEKAGKQKREEES